MNIRVHEGVGRVKTIESLEPELLPKGQVSRFYVKILADGLGEAIRLPLIAARGHKDGPCFGVTAAVHGNELNGIPVIHRLMERVDVARLRGTLVALPVFNAPGFLNHRRAFGDGTDLNHIMPGKANGNEAEVYAHRVLQRVVKRFDRMIDLHTASFGRVNSLYVRADMTQPVTAKMAFLQRPQIIVHNPPCDFTLRGAAMELGIPAITVEIGDPQVFQPNLIRGSLVGLRSVLADMGMIAKRPVREGPRPIICERSYWIYTDHGGLLEVFPSVAERVQAGQPIAQLKDLFGQVTREYLAPQDGVVIGKSVNPVARTGARILHLGVEAPQTDSPYWTPQEPKVAQEEG